MGGCNPLGYFWDLENCPISLTKSAFTFVQSLRKQLGHLGSEVDFVVVCDATKEHKNVLHQLNLAQVNVVHVSSTSKNAADEKLKIHLRKFGSTYSAPGTVVLISSDINFAPELSDLRFRCSFHIVLIHGASVSNGLLFCADTKYLFSDLVVGLSQNDQPLTGDENIPDEWRSRHDGSCILIVRNLPAKVTSRCIVNRLKKLTDNCGGKVVSIDRYARSALVKFADPASTLKAQKRITGEDLYGVKINAELFCDPATQSQSLCFKPSITTAFRPLVTTVPIATLPQVPANKPISGGDEHLSSKLLGKPENQKLIKNSSIVTTTYCSTRLHTTETSPPDSSQLSTGVSTSPPIEPKPIEKRPDLKLLAKELAETTRNMPVFDFHENTETQQNMNSYFDQRSGFRPILPPSTPKLTPIAQIFNFESKQHQRTERKHNNFVFDEFEDFQPLEHSSPKQSFDRQAFAHCSTYTRPAAAEKHRTSFVNNAQCHIDAQSPVDLLVTNLDSSIHIRELKRLLYLAFDQYVRVLHVTVIPQSDGECHGVVQVSSMPDAQLVLSVLQAYVIGDRKIAVAPWRSQTPHENQQNQQYLTGGQTSNNNEPSDFVDSVVRILNDSSNRCMLLSRFLNLYQQIYGYHIVFEDLLKPSLKSYISIGECVAGKLIRLSPRFGNSTVPQRFDSPLSKIAASSSSRAGGSSHQGRTSKLRSSSQGYETYRHNLPPRMVAKQQQQQRQQQIGDSHTRARCHIHPNAGLFSSMMQRAGGLIRVSIGLKCLSANVHFLLEKHGGFLPIASFPGCYQAECNELPICGDNVGVPLEHLLNCLPGIEMCVSEHGFKQLIWARNKPRATHVPRRIQQISDELVELLRHQPECQVAFNEISALYQQHYGHQLQIATVGYATLTDLLEAMSPVIEVLGANQAKTVMLSHSIMMKRFAEDLTGFFEIHMEQMNRNVEIRASEIKLLWDEYLNNQLRVEQYGVCTFEDLLHCLPASFKVHHTGSSIVVAFLPSVGKRIERETEAFRDLKRQIYDLLRAEPGCRLPLSRLSAVYQQQYQNALVVSKFGFVKLADLVVSAGTEIELIDRGNEPIVSLCENDILHVLADRVSVMLSSQLDHTIPLDQFIRLYNEFYGYHLKLADVNCSVIEELISKLSNVVDLVKLNDGVCLVQLLEQRSNQLLTDQILAVFLNQPDRQFNWYDFCQEFQYLHGGATLGRMKKVKKDMENVLKIYNRDRVSLVPVQRFALKVRLLLVYYASVIPILEFEKLFFNVYGERLNYEDYGFNAITGLIRAASHVLYVKGRGSTASVCANRNFLASLSLNRSGTEKYQYLNSTCNDRRSRSRSSPTQPWYNNGSSGRRQNQFRGIEERERALSQDFDSMSLYNAALKLPNLDHSVETIHEKYRTVNGYDYYWLKKEETSQEFVKIPRTPAVELEIMGNIESKIENSNGSDNSNKFKKFRDSGIDMQLESGGSNTHIEDLITDASKCTKQDTNLCNDTTSTISRVRKCRLAANIFCN